LILQPSLQSCSNQTASNPFQVFWGGPDRPPRYLRNVLEKRIASVPAGGEILWATYYFRDERLAAALMDASARGVRVRVVMEGNPRTGAVNEHVASLLKNAGCLNLKVRTLSHYLPNNYFFRRCRLHEKLYYFSHPEPYALVGTFNPSGNQPENPDVLREIGDQDRGHNVLVEISDPTLVRALYDHVEDLFSGLHGPWERFLNRNNRIVVSGDTRLMFFPRSKWHSFNVLFDNLAAGNRLRLAVSHLNDRRMCQKLFCLAARGVAIQIIAHDTKRRVPTWVEREMNKNGIDFCRYVHPEGLPMHNKFILFEVGDKNTLVFGSMNLSVRSLHANHELLFVNQTPELFQSFSSRWNTMLRETTLL
jgi:phosphatidylserine/phosphatidylglycerophosphate/cardiolipin synthase-like enzyme